MLGAGAELLATQLKILTYSTGQDPFTYTRLAMGLLERGMSLEALGSVAGFIIPGWPIVLAMVIKLLGPFAVSWVGFVFMWGALAGLLLLARKRGLSPWGGLLLAWALLWLVWNGEGLYAHFLLYAFRGAPQFFCMVWAFVLLEAAHPAQRSGAFVPGLATCVLLAGALIRETTLIALPGMLAWVALSPAWKNQRWRGMAGLLAPVALLLAAGLVYALASGWGGNQQVKSWWMFLAQLDGTVYVDRLQEYFRLMGAAAGGSGLILFALGIWIQRRQGRWLILWCLPALGLAAFYAVFMVHQRYVLDSYLLLAVVAAAGVAFAVEEAARRTGPKFRAWILGGGLALLLGLNLQATQHLPVWGQRISRAEVKNFVRITRRQVPDGSRLWTDWNCRHLVEVGWTYLDARPLAGGEDFPGRRAAGTGYYWGLSD
ncbi:MAG TPA: hypothetical protein DCM68_00500, partial [Verrucomicrobia bacterium]|nr:hypothetical protein [Verrucomicrobiota bacterium]